MDTHSCEAIVVTCIDFRLQQYIHDFLNQNFQPKTFDRVAIAGGVKDFDYVLKQVEVAHRLHHIKKVILVNHEDCGAYGAESTHEKHSQDLKDTAGKIKNQFNDLETETYYLHLDGTFEKIE